MNICLTIFVLFALAAHISAKGGKQESIKVLSEKKKATAYGTTSYPANYFYNSLLSLPLKDAKKAVEDGDHRGTVDCPYAMSQFKCDPNSPWRSIDGSCNNLKFPWWGTSNSIYKRLLSPTYEKNGAPRANGKDGYPLENPRAIAIKVHYPKDIYIDISAFLATFGQFVNHDLSHFAEIRNKDGTLLKCKCAKKTPSDCINMPIPSFDYYNKDKKCLPQARSLPAFPEFNCYTPYREQLNEVTSWLDLSVVYGNTQKDADNLRQFKFGKLKMSSFEGLSEEFLPTGCKAFELTKNVCFRAGDDRVNQYPMLTSHHTLWAREHNRIADILWHLNPTWSDELTYQSARNINIAQFQNIVFGQFLELLIGKQLHKIFDLGTEKEGYFMEYDQEIFPNVANEYSAAAARYGHPLTVPYETQIDSYFNVYKNHSLWNLMFNPNLLLREESMDGFIRGAILERGNWFSTHLTDYLSNDVMVDMGPHNPSSGHSLSALNINRGRDHGIAGYNYYRPLAGLPKAKSWDDLTYIPKSAIARLKEVYASVDDIDLFTGGTSEYPLPDAVVGPTFAWILARGFRDWKYGDRWYFENGNDKRTRFPLSQLNEIRKSTMSRIICDNTGIKQVTQNPFLIESKTNYIVDCADIPSVNLNFWKDHAKLN